MKTAVVLLSFVLLCMPVSAQSLVEPVYETQRAFEAALGTRGVRSAFEEFLADDAVIFRPEAVNGPEFLRVSNSGPVGSLTREVHYADVSNNGLLAYTIGEWTLKPSARPNDLRVGEYATVWSKVNGKYKAILDIEVSHPFIDRPEDRLHIPKPRGGHTNKQGWSATDATMNFLRTSMSEAGLGRAYDMFAAEDVILLRDGLPPIVGRGLAEHETKKYAAVDFPKRVAQFQTGDMAYSWNPCSYADSNEGMERGNCLHIWKFRDKKWYILLGVFAKVVNTTKPILRETADKGN